MAGSFLVVDEQVHELVHHDVFEIFGRHGRERLSDPQPALWQIERSERAHFSDAKLAQRHAQDRLPFIEEFLHALRESRPLLVIRDLAVELACRLHVLIVAQAHADSRAMAGTA